jgi:hypothetical protein
MNELIIKQEDIKSADLYVKSSDLIYINPDELQARSIIFGISKNPKIMEISEKGFFWNGEKVEDALGVYEKMAEFLSIALPEKAQL